MKLAGRLARAQATLEQGIQDPPQAAKPRVKRRRLADAIGLEVDELDPVGVVERAAPGLRRAAVFSACGLAAQEHAAGA